MGDEGGFAPNLKDNEEALKVIMEAIVAAGYQPGQEVFIALDVAASSFWKDGKYLFEGKTLSSLDMIEHYTNLVQKYPIISLEDGLAENDWENWITLTQLLGNKIQLVGDDLLSPILPSLSVV